MLIRDKITIVSVFVPQIMSRSTGTNMTVFQMSGREADHSPPASVLNGAVLISLSTGTTLTFN
jgi:hypothetical protein